MAEEFASAFNAGPEAEAAGLLHDLAKYGDLFQRRLQGLEKGIDHWSPGAWQALMKYKTNGLASALAIQGHHLGLGRGGKDDLARLNPERLKVEHPLGLRLSSDNIDNLMERMRADGLNPPDEIGPSLFPGPGKFQGAGMLDVRMLFSTLVDADFLDTEAHFQGESPLSPRRYRPAGPQLNPELLFKGLMDYLGALSGNIKASAKVMGIRRRLLEACLSAAENEPGVFTLTAPTGAGKTLSLLAFALKHALVRRMRRIVVVMPYLTIIEQTADEYRKVFSDLVPVDQLDAFVLEHHSLAGLRKSRPDQSIHEDYREDQESRKIQWLTENWDAPFILTTSVQFFESLFANRPGPCRKLHRLAGSIILFDEAQTLPAQLAVPTLAALSRLTEKYRASVVFSTATQPAFDHLAPAVKRLAPGGWAPVEINTDARSMFSRSSRVTVEWRNIHAPDTPLADLAEELSGPENRQVLCILNLKRHALRLLELLQEKDSEGLMHLSTNMCPAHRREALKEIRSRLEANLPCRLVSTQCVEAGVDLDFPTVFRAHGPLEAAAQAAGRCNRHGLRPSGRVVIFTPREQGGHYPDPAYGQGASAALMMLKKVGGKGLDLADHEVFREYYQTLYELTRPECSRKELNEAVERLDFEATARHYRLIEQNSINVLCPFDIRTYRELADQVRSEGLTNAWKVGARAHSIGLFKPRPEAPVRKWLEPVPVGRGLYSDEWFIYLNENHYDRLRGLIPPSVDEVLIA